MLTHQILARFHVQERLENEQTFLFINYTFILEKSLRKENGKDSKQAQAHSTQHCVLCEPEGINLLLKSSSLLKSFIYYSKVSSASAS